MNTDMRRITRTNDGYQVRFQTQRINSGLFPSKAAARKWRDEQEKKLGLTAADYGRRRPRKTYGDSENTGAFVSCGFKAGRFYAHVLAVLNYQDEEGISRRKSKTFNIAKLGYRKAYVEAIKARCEMTNEVVPKNIEVPQLTDKHRQLMLDNGISKTLLA